MSNEMKIAGVAPLIAIPTFIYLTTAIILSYSSGNQFNILNDDKIVSVVMGIILILIGIIMVAHCGRKLLRSFNKNILMTDGLYKIVRDPMYAAYLIFVIPGIAFIFNSWLALTTIIINFVLYSILIRREHRYLEEKFGEEYLNYKKMVLIKFL